MGRKHQPPAVDEMAGRIQSRLDVRDGELLKRLTRWHAKKQHRV